MSAVKKPHAKKVPSGEKIVKYGMVINVDKCTGCGACMVACAAENNVNVLPDESNKVRSITWMRVYKVETGGKYPHSRVAYIPRPCMHCEGARHHDFFGRPVRGIEDIYEDKHGAPDTPCISVCPPTATDYEPEGGIVSQVPTRCIGCRYCVAACPYHARYFNWFDGDWPDGMERYLNPQVAPRMRGVVEKCTFCHHRLMAARAKLTYQAKIAAAKAKKTGPVKIDPPRYQTACAEACPAGAIGFGIISDPREPLAEMIKRGHIETHKKAAAGGPKWYKFRLLEDLNTNPKVHYVTRRKWIMDAANNSLARPFAAQLYKS